MSKLILNHVNPKSAMSSSNSSPDIKSDFNRRFYQSVKNLDDKYQAYMDKKQRVKRTERI